MYIYIYISHERSGKRYFILRAILREILYLTRAILREIVYLASDLEREIVYL